MRPTAALTVALLALLAGLPRMAAAQAHPETFRVGPVTASQGELASGFLEIAPRPGDEGTRIPISVVHGVRPGPVLALVAGTHGAEVAPILALQRLRARLDAGLLAGTLILVHVANMPSFLRRTVYYSPVDGKNLNRVYPGRPDGTISERIAHAITTEVIERADYLVDMHAGDGNESLRPYTYWNRLGLDARADSVGREMALAWGNDHIVIDTERPRDPAASIYTQNTAHVRGKPAITTESGYLGLPAEEMIQRNEEGALRLMRWLGMIDGPREVVDAPVWIRPTEVLRSPATGLWYRLVRRGQTVAAGAPLGYLTDFFGGNRRAVRSTLAGIVLYVVATPAMSQGEPVGMVGEVAR
ncbi:MAG: M14 family metallopeptidase [Longimicrobiales bacterium]